MSLLLISPFLLLQNLSRTNCHKSSQFLSIRLESSITFCANCIKTCNGCCYYFEQRGGPGWSYKSWLSCKLCKLWQVCSANPISDIYSVCSSNFLKKERYFYQKSHFYDFLAPASIFLHTAVNSTDVQPHQLESYFFGACCIWWVLKLQHSVSHFIDVLDAT